MNMLDIFAHLKDKFVTHYQNSNDSLSFEYLIPTVVSELIEENKATVKVLRTSATWLGVTYREDKENVCKSLKELVDSGQYKKGLW